MTMSGQLHTLRIYFFGLICHVGPEGNARIKTNAAIIKDADHVPRIYFGPDDYSCLSGASTVKFQGLGAPGGAAPDLLFRRFVPSLRNMFGCGIDPGYEEKAIMVHYPASVLDRRGVLSVVDFYPRRAIYRSGSTTVHRGCVARLTELTVVTRVEKFNVVAKANKPVHREVPADSCLLIANISRDVLNPDLPHLSPSKHLQKHAHILKNPQQVEVVECRRCGEPCGGGCGWVMERIRNFAGIHICTSIHVECRNSAYP